MEKMNKAAVQAWKQRWEIVNQFEIEELRRTPPEIKYQQFLTLLAWAKEYEWTEELAKGEAEVRARWVRLKKAQRG